MPQTLTMGNEDEGTFWSIANEVCYSLDLKVSFKDPCVKGLMYGLWHIREVVDFKR
jgi:hypothetical protein